MMRNTYKTMEPLMPIRKEDEDVYMVLAHFAMTLDNFDKKKYLGPTALPLAQLIELTTTQSIKQNKNAEMANTLNEMRQAAMLGLQHQLIALGAETSIDLSDPKITKLRANLNNTSLEKNALLEALRVMGVAAQPSSQDPNIITAHFSGLPVQGLPADKLRAYYDNAQKTPAFIAALQAASDNAFLIETTPTTLTISPKSDKKSQEHFEDLFKAHTMFSEVDDEDNNKIVIALDSFAKEQIPALMKMFQERLEYRKSEFYHPAQILYGFLMKQTEYVKKSEKGCLFEISRCFKK